MRSVSPFKLNKPEASWNTNLRDASCYMLIEFTLTVFGWILMELQKLAV